MLAETFFFSTKNNCKKLLFLHHGLTPFIAHVQQYTALPNAKYALLIGS